MTVAVNPEVPPLTVSSVVSVPANFTYVRVDAESLIIRPVAPDTLPVMISPVVYEPVAFEVDSVGATASVALLVDS